MSIVFGNETSGSISTPATAYVGYFSDSVTQIWSSKNQSAVVNTYAVRPQNVYFQPANPTLTSSVTFVMMGCSSGATKITPGITGNLNVMVTGSISNTIVGDGASVQIKVGIGNGPGNGSAVVGTSVGTALNYIADTAAGRSQFCAQGRVTGLTLYTAYYIDVALKAVTSGNAAVYDLGVDAYEY